MKETPRKPKKSGKAKAAIEGKTIKKGGKAKAKKSPSKSPAKGKGKAATKARSKSPKKSVTDKRVIQHGEEEPWESEASASRVSRVLPLNDQQRAESLSVAGTSARVDPSGQTLPLTPVETLPRPSERRIRRMKQIDTGMLSHAVRGDTSDSSMSVSELSCGIVNSLG